jgi:hypothetical protein
MNNTKQKIYFILNLVVLLPLLLAMLSNLLIQITDYFKIQSLLIDGFRDFSLWHIDVILNFIFRNSGSMGLEGLYFEVMILILQAILSLLLIVLGYFSGLLRGRTLKIMVGLYLFCWLLYFASIPIENAMNDRRTDELRNEYMKFK